MKQMRGCKLGHDPIYENEIMSKRDDDLGYDEGTLRFTKTKAILRKQGWGEKEGDDEIEFRRSVGSRKRGTMEIKICTWQHRKLADSVRCNHGHDHPVIRVDDMWLESIEITIQEAEALARWILGEGRE